MTYTHLRHLSVTMRGLEDALIMVELALKGPTESLMTVYKDEVASAAHAEIRDQISQIKQQIKLFRDHYALSPQTISKKHWLSTMLMHQSIDLTEATSGYLRAFGQVPADEQQPLDETIKTIIQLVEDLKELVEIGD